MCVRARQKCNAQSFFIYPPVQYGAAQKVPPCVFKQTKQRVEWWGRKAMSIEEGEMRQHVRFTEAYAKINVAICCAAIRRRPSCPVLSQNRHMCEMQRANNSPEPTIPSSFLLSPSFFLLLLSTPETKCPVLNAQVHTANEKCLSVCLSCHSTSKVSLMSNCPVSCPRHTCPPWN